MEWVTIAKYIGAGLAVSFAGIGSGIGEGYIAGRASESIVRQPKVAGETLRTMLITQAVTETAAIFGLLVAIMLLFVVSAPNGLIPAAAYLGAGICMGIGAIGAGLGSGVAGGFACESVARNPNNSTNTLITTLIGQAISQTGTVFALVISLVLLLQHAGIANAAPTTICAMVAAGICMGIGSIGAGVGAGIAGGGASRSVGRYPGQSSGVILTMLIGQAISQTGAIFALVISLLLLFAPPSSTNIAMIGAVFGAGFAMGFGAIGAGVGSGYATAKATWETARNPKQSMLLLRTMLLGQAVEHAGAIYSLLIAFILLLGQNQ